MMYGSGDPIVALHGLGGSIYTWRHFAESKRFKNNKLILIDFKGAGNSPKPHDKKYSIIDQADLIYEFIQEYDLKNLTLMGNSYGGAVSLYLAIRLCKENPKRLSKLILIDSGGYDKDLPTFLKILRTPLIGWLAVHILSPQKQAGIVLRASYFDDRKITKEQIDAYARPIGSPGGRYALLQTARQAIPRNVKEIIAQYPSINVPTLILWGLEDRVLPLKIGKMLHEAIPGSRLELINNCGHVPQEERPEETICWVAEFLGLPFEPCPK
jgi:pimeloyl-ACP methyl ester carboxylesterase